MANIEPQPDESGALPVATSSPKTRKALSRLKREINEDELAAPGVQKMLIAEVERLDDENSALVRYRDQYYETAIELAISTQKLNEKRAAEIISIACTALGGAALGYVPAVWDQQKSTGEMAIAVGVVLLLAAVAAKVVRQ